MARTDLSHRRRARRLRRLTAAAVLPLGLMGLAACDPPAIVSFVVTSGADSPDAAIGDGVCAAASGLCTLRAAVQEGNAETDPGVVEIVVSTAVASVSGATDEDAAATGDLDLTRQFRIVSATGVERIELTGTDRVFDVHPGADTVLRNLEIRGSSTASVAEGGVVRAQGATVTVDRTLLTRARASAGGGAIHSDGLVIFLDSATRSVSTTAGPGGAVSAAQALIARSSIETNGGLDATAIELTDPVENSAIVSSTVSGGTQVSPGTGSAIVAAGPLHIGDSTIFGVDAPSGALSGPSITLANSLLAGGGDPNCAAPVTSNGHNLEDGSSCGLAATGDISNTNPAFKDIVTAGRVRMFSLAPGIAIDSGSGCSSTDGLGSPRPVDGNGDLTAACDRGAVENPLTTMSLNVDTSADGVDVAPGDGRCMAASGDCTLRAAIQETNLWPAADFISLVSAPSVVLSVAGAGEDAAASGDLDITDDLTVAFNSGGVGTATVDGADLDRVFDVHSGTVLFSRVVVTNGFEGTSAGGAGIRTASGTNVTIDRSRVTGNEVFVAASGGGGGIRAAGTLTIDESVVDANRAGSSGGGGAYLLGVATISNSTFSGNTSTNGSGIRVLGASTLTLTDSTVASNLTGAGILRAGTVNVQNTIVANHSGGNCLPALTSLGHNLDSGTSCGFTGTGDAQSTNPLLGALANNGGQTLTHLPAAGSPAIGTGVCISARDQRLFSRPLGGACDKGAVEQV